MGAAAVDDGAAVREAGVVGEARLLVLLLVGVMVMQVCRRVDRVSAVPLVLADDLEEGDWDEAAGVGEERVAGLVPVLVVLSADDVEEVSLAERELLSVLGRRLVVVQRFYHLSRGQLWCCF